MRPSAALIRKAPRQDRSRKAAAAMLRVGLKGIEEHGIEALSMNDVAAEAGSSIGALYFRFGDKAGLVRAALELAIDEFVRRGEALLEDAVARNQTTEQILRRWIRLQIDVVRRRRHLVREMLGYAARRPESWDPIHRMREALRDELFAALERQGARPLDPDRVMRLRIGLQIVGGTLIQMVIVNPGPLRLDDPTLEGVLVDLLLSYAMAQSDGDRKNGARTPRRGRRPRGRNR
jgi:AcrR family transcriptional regulator